ncbi:MAG: acetyl CoA synthetase subunit alpha [Chlamydiae bacterium RIFCSPHIGHO2_12_FULL_44_59]|nr:MAG: acetyl CoA synthetase subunit alpha [Chlamydiae bacterium RIFCSPHIGHO2_01_FULL_44_39]OGN59844.1 MAG: acetyl CoA synthetase subunit alpha [Chlamydiae bacterium RIFCSPHIGHO2_12_FULL_44_59]OGN66051.1 MAG: acetyl CoA synthetase subunit alpha [Chlamydiae bacterium RIFCSPLOWO2_01_FULL_44_52]OGN68587.1 MAG: acetyl CoA synthetase subunit alpha [Chlamydiae bacterium RIFCSPLOWO2_02_FULL_45_22]OGN69699.1 MAG: acetyl CoA synthetase subunit alpha [Chlamydiae bacterium RIFCSPLOWO2_12_FULL_45_20]
MSEPSFDPSMNILHRRTSELDFIFHPKTVAVVGATEAEGSVGRTIMQNLLATPFGGEVFPVNPKRDSVFGLKAYQTLTSIGKTIDLIVVVIPAKWVPSVIQEAADLKIPASIIISAGFKEMGPPGLALEKEILHIARKSGMRVIGPNCLGVMNPLTGLNATFAAGIAQKGNIAFISQSGALLTAVLDWSLREKVGFSAFVSIGSMVDVDWGDLIHYFGNDPETKSILIYMESIGDPRTFLSAAREISLTKPIILIKAGRTLESAKAAASHTGSLSGSDEALSAALKRVGVLRVDTIADLFSITEAMAKQPRPNGPSLMIVTNAGGPGVIATDALISNGGLLAPIDEKTIHELNQILPAPWSHNNPVDILGDASPEMYAKTIEILMNGSDADGLLVILTPQDMTDPTKTAEMLKPFAHLPKPILASWMGAASVKEGDQILADAGIPSFEFPDAACKTFALMWQYSYNLRGIYEVPEAGVEIEPKNRARVEEIFQAARNQKRTILDEVESKEVLEAYHIPCVPTRMAQSKEEAMEWAEALGYPIVLKVFSRTITHKTEVGGVKLNLQSKDEVARAFDAIFFSVQKRVGKEHFQGVTVQPMIRLEGYELILGSSVDEQFGPVLLFGSGGQLVEVYKDRALGLPPLTTTLAKRMMEQTHIYQALLGVRGRKSVDLKQLEKILVQFSHLIANELWIQECDINPLLASSDQLIALDARVILHPPETKIEDLPKPAIRPYPTQYIEHWTLKDGTSVRIRPIRPEDEPEVIQFHKDLSQETVRQRYLKILSYEERVAHERLIHICFNDYDREIALVLEKGKEILGMIRLSKGPGGLDATFFMVVKDRWQNRGIGSKLMAKILEISRREGLQKIRAKLLEENFQMQALLKHFGFHLQEKGKIVFAEKTVDLQ